MSNSYNADAIEVLTGLDPVRKRPGMYTDTTRPNHLVQEVIDNSVDEALAGHAKTITVTMERDGMIEVTDDGRGMPVDVHPEEKVSGVELILTRLHAGGKFSNKNYQFSGGLHGVGVSVVNALSKHLEVIVRRNGTVYQMKFRDGNKVSELTPIGTAPKRMSGTTVRFLPDEKYFDSSKVSLSRLKHVLRAKAVLCSGLRVVFIEHAFTWILPLMWRMDAIYEARKSWMDIKRKPSEYVKDHIKFTTQPLDYPEDKTELLRAFEWMECEKILLFSSDYPHWTYDDPRWLVKHLPEHAREAVMFRNGLETYKLPATVPALEGQMRVF